MQLYEYQDQARRTAKQLSPPEAYDHMAMGVSSDFGELISIVKAITVYGKKMDAVYDSKLPKKGSTRDKILEEAGDVCWFIAYGCDLIGAQFQQVVSYPLADPVFMSVYHMADGIEYWAKAGATVTGQINSLVLMGTVAPAAVQTSLLSEFAKLYACVGNITTKSGWDISDVLKFNIAKLRLRYPDKYSDLDALERKDV